jgi:hypothetical protein
MELLSRTQQFGIFNPWQYRLLTKGEMDCLRLTWSHSHSDQDLIPLKRSTINCRNRTRQTFDEVDFDDHPEANQTKCLKRTEKVHTTFKCFFMNPQKFTVIKIDIIETADEIILFDKSLSEISVIPNTHCQQLGNKRSFNIPSFRKWLVDAHLTMSMSISARCRVQYVFHAGME